VTFDSHHLCEWRAKAGASSKALAMLYFLNLGDDGGATAGGQETSEAAKSAGIFTAG
jgi:hypothetical protein